MQIVGTTSLPTFLILPINHIFSSHVYSLTVSFIADTIFLLPQCSASLTHTIYRSLCCLALFPLLPVWYKKILANLCTLSLFWINYSVHKVCISLRGLLTIIFLLLNFYKKASSQCVELLLNLNLKDII